MNSNEKLVAIMNGNWKECSVAFMIVPEGLSLQDRRDHNDREFPELSFEEYLKKVDCGREAGDEDIELYATGIDPNEKPYSGE
tara:strand:- start:485 stop:733 length:249 start_codon:yes stop_codon:yes gene_type:complete